eukprot:Sdes_comp15846_c0_seq1m4932
MPGIKVKDTNVDQFDTKDESKMKKLKKENKLLESSHSGKEKTETKSSKSTKIKADKGGKKSSKDSSEKKKKRSKSISDSDEKSLKKSKVAKEAESSVDCEDSSPAENAPDKTLGDLEAFRLDPRTIELLQAKGVTRLFPIQVATFDYIYDGKDVIGRARTGTGKTLSFALPIIAKLRSTATGSRAHGRSPSVLVMAPTRELARQVHEDFSSIGDQFSCTCLYGGAPYDPQERDLRRGVDVVVGTPGRLIDHLHRGNLRVDAIKFMVLDEADQMLDIGFADALDEILDSVKQAATGPYQSLLFSATLPSWVQSTADKYLQPDRLLVDLIGNSTVKTGENIKMLAIRCSWQERASTLKDVVKVHSGGHGRTIIFSETKREANELAMDSFNNECQVLHGDIPQKQRETTLAGFRSGKFNVLIATDVAARGLDIPEVDLVIQCEPPKDSDTFVHRSGRTGRAGKSGVNILFYKPQQEFMVKNIERRTKVNFIRIGPPQPSDIIEAVANDVAKSLSAISPDVLSHFSNTAKKMIEEKGAEQSLAAALAHISGYTQIKSRSLLNSAEGFCTLLITTKNEFRTASYVWAILRKNVPENIVNSIRGMRMCKDCKGAAFDCAIGEVENLMNSFPNSEWTSLTKPTTLPDLVEAEPQAQENHSRGFGGRGGRGNNRSSSHGSFQNRSYSGRPQVGASRGFVSRR